MNEIPGLQISELTKDFGGLKAVDQISFHVNEGEFVGLIGPNGCGKTTTFNCISGMFEITSGRREMTVIENLLVPPRDQFAPNPIISLLRPHNRKAEKKRVNDAYDVLDLLEVSHIAHNLADELSGGQSKLVDIGRALMSAPRFLLLDEPVAGVSGPLAERIFQNLRTLTSKEGIGMLVIEHNMDFILRRDVDRIIVMDRGEILIEGKDVVDAYLGNPGKQAND